MNKDKIGELEVRTLRQWRVKRYLTFKALSDMAGVSIDVLLRAEKNKPISDISKARIVDALGIDTCQVLEWINSKE